SVASAWSVKAPVCAQLGEISAREGSLNRKSRIQNRKFPGSSARGHAAPKVEARRLLGRAHENPAVTDHRSRPAFPIDHLRPCQFQIAVRFCGYDDEFTGVAERNQVAIRQHGVTRAEAFLFPLHFAARHGDTFNRAFAVLLKLENSVQVSVVQYTRDPT